MPKRDLKQLQLSRRHLGMLRDLLRQRTPDAEVWAYGSRVTGVAHEGSDLDIVLRNAADPSAEVEGWSDVQDAVQESNLPMLVDIHDWASLPVEFHRSIEKGYVVIQEVQPSREDRAGR